MGVAVLDYQPIYSEKQGVRYGKLLAGRDGECHLWADILDPGKAEVLATYTGQPYSGKAAITSHSFGEGKAVYVGAHLEPADLARVLLTLIATAGVKGALEAPAGVEVTRRRTDHGTITFLLNHTNAPQSIPVAGTNKELLTGSTRSGTVSLEPYGVSILQSV
jgi:beta-galactosidase